MGVIQLSDYRRRRDVEYSEAYAIDRWGAQVTISLPANGPERHPRLLDKVARHVGRVCAVDTEYEQGLSIGFGAEGETYDEALADARTVSQVPSSNFWMWRLQR